MSSVGSTVTGCAGSDGGTSTCCSVSMRYGGVEGTTGRDVAGSAANEGEGSARASCSETCRDDGTGSDCTFCLIYVERRVAGDTGYLLKGCSPEDGGSASFSR